MRQNMTQLEYTKQNKIMVHVNVWLTEDKTKTKV